MKYRKKLKDLFINALTKSNLKCIEKNRLLDESDYFDAYLDFIHNSIHYSRYSINIKGRIITGKYLNEKVNKWRKYCIIDIMNQDILNEYKKTFSSKIYHIDGKIITNRYCNETSKLGRNVKYKSKNSINLQSVVDDFGISLGISILKGSDSEIGNMINVLKEIDIENVNHLKNSNKHKKYFTADAGYDSVENRTYLNDKGYIDLIWYNKRNTKDTNVIKKRKLTGHKREKYKKRHIVETYFSWIDNKIPRLAKIYDKKIKNYTNMVYMATIDLIIGRMCV